MSGIDRSIGGVAGELGRFGLAKYGENGHTQDQQARRTPYVLNYGVYIIYIIATAILKPAKHTQ
ncbi:uncharacterized protein BDR25DRAFT_300278 [Lindgomyces ingoldianus]|uniref:Uncharacterized protein n=1 Tax=Lindgomyces ingoldianus TaxID=673940 RepID=A0ACB6RD96_9PLEO|nr:uncharacterized protein BDR25DRAFT_300278 [Lindgomyces ingoldianus]KAF2477304.1 hypothetical protein BDR25DRAFT_300278 [Lindgomyces ingoldianus]